MRQAALDPTMRTWVLVWFVAASYLLLKYWRSGATVGLILTYIISFGSIHWLAAVLYLLPWYSATDAGFVAEGMKQSALAMVAFAVGVEVVARRYAARAQQSMLASHSTDEEIAAASAAWVNPLAAQWYLVAGLFLYGLISPFVGRLPTLTALVNTGSAIIVVGVSLKCWNAWQMGQRSRIWAWLAATTILPFVTVTTQGFLGAGMAALVTIYAFVAAFYGLRWKVVVASILMAQIGLSVYVTYMRDRGDIRATVWGGSRLSDRFDKVRESIRTFEWFDIYNVDHLARIDERLNQDWLVGAAVANLRQGHVDFAYGTTYREAVLAIIPRALWPDKPMAAGSGDLVATYTGMHFMKDTSVGIGQVMECYINFGTPGVLVTFMLIGGLMTLIEIRAYASLHYGDIPKFCLWYLPGLSLLNVGGSFVEVTSSAGAGVMMALLLRFFLRRRQHDVGVAKEAMLVSSRPPDMTS